MNGLYHAWINIKANAFSQITRTAVCEEGGGGRYH